MGDFVRLEVEDGVGTIRLDRPPMNALNAQVQREIRSAAEEASERSDVAAVVVYGGEKVFAAGADIKEMAEQSYADMVHASHGITDSIDAVARIGKPVVAAITGYALGGGCELALACDRRIAASDARLGQPEIRLGVIPGAGGTQRLPRLIGPSKAKDLIFTGRMVEAAEALAIGLVDELVDMEADGADGSWVYERARAWAGQFVGGPTLALRAAKAAIDHGLTVDLHTGREIERQHFAAMFGTEDRTTGMTAFIQKEPPRFQGQ
ncbi:MAG TPA: enoyl-CoA hydratase-related protein [Actinopolymorphaceae bacterium]